MKAMVVFLGLFLLPAAIAQEKMKDQPNGQIYGIVVGPQW